MTAYVNRPLTVADDDEFFDAPAGAMLINTDGEVAYTRLETGWAWQAADGTTIDAGALWHSFFPSGDPHVALGLKPGEMTAYVLRVDLAWAERYGMMESREAEEAAAEAWLANLMLTISTGAPA